jgi:hypothetical protein
MSNVRHVLAAAAIAAAGFSVPVLVPAVIAAAVVHSIGPAEAACGPGDRINSSTATQAKAEMQKAGFRDIHDLKKGCDNDWHGTATKNGQETHVVATADGNVMREGD